jgi:hypothetical protein
MKLTLALIAICCAVPAFAHEEPKPAEMPKEFDTMKGLVGSWEGMNDMHGEKKNMTVTYEMTSGGTAIAEHLGVGTPHEMLTVYHKEGNSLGVTHFCAMGNAPQMHLKKAEANMLAFEMTKPLGISSMKEMHMHAITLKMPDADTLTQEWTNWENGKKGEVAVFTFHRKK